jgi:hypothetical protein
MIPFIPPSFSSIILSILFIKSNCVGAKTGRCKRISKVQGRGQPLPREEKKR